MTKLVLLPGLDGTGELFAPFVQALGGLAHQVVAYPVDRPMDYAEHVTFAVAKLPTEEEFVLLGESFSGPIAISIAASHPPRLRGLVLCASFASNPLPLFGPFAGIVGELPAVKFPAAMAAPWLYAGRATQALQRMHAEAMEKVSAEVINARVAAVLGADFRAQLDRIEVPMLYLRATADRLIPAAAWRSIHERRRDVELDEFEAPHFLLQTEPVACAEAVKKFLQRCAA